MLKITLEDTELWDEASHKFVYIKGGTYTFNHSLRTIAKWESITLKPFLKEGTKPSADEMLLYFQIMCDNELDVTLLSKEQVTMIEEYIANPHTATKLSKPKDASSRKSIISAEVIYASMVEARIPFECQDWHINNLLTLIGVLDARANPKKMSRRETYRNNDKLNESRKKTYGTRG